jgi:hypothetical protein
MAKHPFAKLNRLWRRDLVMFARHLDVADLPGRPLANEVRAIAAIDELARTDSAFATPAEEARWRIAEELLWLGAVREALARKAAAIRDGDLFEIRVPSQERRETFRAFGAQAREKLGEELYRIVLVILLLDRANDSAAMGPAVDALSDYITKVEKEGQSRTQTKNTAGKSRKSPADTPTGKVFSKEEQKEEMRKLRKRYPKNRPRAKREFAQATGLSLAHANRVAVAIGWNGEVGRRSGTKNKTKKN